MEIYSESIPMGGPVGAEDDAQLTVWECDPGLLRFQVFGEPTLHTARVQALVAALQGWLKERGS